MATMNGVVEALARTGKGLKIGENWYSAFTAGMLNGAKVGDNVSFVYTEVVKEGTTYRNIKGAVSIKEGGAPEPAAGRPAAASGGSSFSKGGRSFPVGPLDPERSIIRQNSLTQANKLLEGQLGEMPSYEEQAHTVISVARIFESYSAGDMDAEEAAAAVDSLRSGMTKD